MKNLRKGFVVSNDEVIGSIMTTESAGMKQFATDYMQDGRNGSFKGYIGKFPATLSFSKKNEAKYNKLVDDTKIYHYNYNTNILEY